MPQKSVVTKTETSRLGAYSEERAIALDNAPPNPRPVRNRIRTNWLKVATVGVKRGKNTEQKRASYNWPLASPAIGNPARPPSLRTSAPAKPIQTQVQRSGWECAENPPWTWPRIRCFGASKPSQHDHKSTHRHGDDLEAAQRRWSIIWLTVRARSMYSPQGLIVLPHGGGMEAERNRIAA